VPLYSSKIPMINACSPPREPRWGTPRGSQSPASRLATPKAVRPSNILLQREEERMTLATSQITMETRREDSGKILPDIGNTDVAFYLQETVTDDKSIDLIESKDDDSNIEGESKVDLITISQQTSSEQEQETKSQNKTDVSFYLEEGFNDNSAEFIENEEDPVKKIASSSRRIDMDGAIRHKIVLYSEMKEDESITPTSRQDYIGTKTSTPFDRTPIRDEKPHPASKIRLRKEPAHTPQVTRESVETISERRKASTTQRGVDMTDTARQTNVVATAPNTTKAMHETPVADIAEPVGCGCGLFRSRRRS
jgi:hypothetical protein